MKIGLFNTFDNEGGAARAAYRLHKGLIKSGNESTLFVQKKQLDEKEIVGPKSKIDIACSAVMPTLDAIPLSFYPKRNGSFSTGLLSSLNINRIADNFDILNFHWLGGGFQSIRSITNINKPLVLTLHDSWAFTGGCHIPFECERFTESCGKCFQLGSLKQNDLSARILKKKKKVWEEKNIVLVGDGNWVADNARRSFLFKNSRIEVVHPGLDINVYKPLDKKLCREILGFSDTDKIILFGAISATSNYNKGFHMLIPALKKLESIYSDCENLKLVIFGASDSSGAVLDTKIKTRYMGRLNDDISLSILYSAADLMVVPSLQECFGQTASESFACGTPVAAFDTTGLKDIIDHKINGFLAKAYDPIDLAIGIDWLLSDSERLSYFGKLAREKAVNNFSIEKYVESYLEIYKSII